MTAPLVFLINPSAGSADTVAAAIDALGPEAPRIDVQRHAAGDMRAALEAALAGKPQRIIVGGGDGTLRLAAPLLAEAGVEMGIVPLGTANLLARDLGLPLDPLAALKQALAPETRRIALATVNDRPFFVGALIGRAAHAASRLRERARKIGVPGLVSGAMATLSAWTRIAPQPLAVVADGKTHRVRSRALAVVLGEVVGQPGQAFHRDRIAKGPLTVYGAPASIAALALGVGGQLLASNPVGSGGVRLAKWQLAAGDALVVTSPHRRLHVTLDGEPRLLTPPLHFRVDPEALAVAAPPAARDDPSEPAGFSEPAA